MVKFMETVKSLGYQDKPAYQQLRSILEAGLKSIGATDDDKLNFAVSANGAGSSSTKVRCLLSQCECLCSGQSFYFHLLAVPYF